MWSILKREVYENGAQFSSKEALWARILAVSQSIGGTTVRQLTKYMDDRLCSVISKHGGYINR